MSLWVIFLTGLTTGGLSCLAVQGGLLTSIIANQKEDELEKQTPQTKPGTFDQLDWAPILLFLGSKLVAHVILGLFLGWLGSQLEMSLGVRLAFQGFAALFMLFTAFNLLELHPVFRHMVFQPPKFINKWLKNTSKGKAFFTPALLGLMTIFIPCGVTQSMEVLAMTSGSPIMGGVILGAFVLGTSPLFAVIGIATTKLSETFHKSFLKVTAITLIFLAASSFNGILVVLNSPITLTSPITWFFSNNRLSKNTSVENAITLDQQGVQAVTISARNNGYFPKTFTVKSGVPVQLTVETKDTFSCASSFVFKPFNVSFQLGPNDAKVAHFTPTEKGTYQFTCGMGMYTGTMEVI